MSLEYHIVGNYYAYSTEITLGSGTFGNVYLAKDLRSNEQVALKKIKKEQRNLQAIQIEVEILRQVKNGNVIKLIDDFDTPNHKILILELCDQNLREYLRQVGRVNERIALRFFLELINGFQSLHEIGYCHRDIKPDNILLKDGQIKIIDVNVAKKYQQDQKIVSFYGTKQYMAPEVIQKDSHSPYKADIYSLGIVFYEILYGLQDVNEPRYFHFNNVIVNDRIVNLITNMLKQEEKARWDWQQVSEELKNIEESINQPDQKEVQSSIILNCSNYYIEKSQESVDFLKLIIKNIAIQQFQDLDPYPCALLLIKLIIQKTEQKLITLLKKGLYEQSNKYKTELHNQLIQYRKTFLNETKQKKDQLVRIVVNKYNSLTEHQKEIENEFQYVEQSEYFTLLYQFFIADLFQKIQSLNENRLQYKILQVQLLIAFDYYNDYENVQRQLILNNLIKNIRISKILQNFNFNNEVADKYIIALKPLLEQREID